MAQLKAEVAKIAAGERRLHGIVLAADAAASAPPVALAQAVGAGGVGLKSRGGEHFAIRVRKPWLALACLASPVGLKGSGCMAWTCTRNCRFCIRQVKGA